MCLPFIRIYLYHMNKTSIGIFLVAIVVAGFWFRLSGIVDNHSFWSDEAFVATLARDVLQDKRTLNEAISQYDYQRLHLLTTITSFMFFGFSEFAARLPPVLFGSLGIVAAYLLASRLSNRAGGVLAAFVFAFSQLMIANDTQAKSYSALTFLFLSVLYFLHLLEQKKKNTATLHVLIILFASLASLFHYLGIIIFIPYIIFLLIRYRSYTRIVIKKPVQSAAVILIGGALFFFLGGGYVLTNFFSGSGITFFIPVNNITYFRELLWRNYAFITLPAIVGILIGVYDKKYTWSISIILFLLFYSYLWIFKQGTHNIRYIIPLIGILFVYCGVFWAKVAEKLFPKQQLLFITILIVLLYLGGYKIVRKPSAYYSPNADLYGDVQNADYKTFFAEVHAQYPDLKDTAVFTDWGDTQRWYLPEKPISAYFMKRFEVEKAEPNIIDNVMMYGTLDQFLAEKQKYDKGLLVVEDWVSFLPDDIKTYARKNLKRELRVEHLPQAPGDAWPLELYSWGMD